MSKKNEISSDLFLQIVNVVNSATTLESLFRSTMEFAPITMASYHHFPSVGALDYKTLGTFHGYNLPPAIENYYKAYNMKRSDPGLAGVFANGSFVWLSDLPYAPNVVAAGHSKMVTAAMDQTGDGLCIPLYGPNNRRGYMFIAGGPLKKEGGSFIAYQVQALAGLFHTRFCMIIQNIERQINLTKREAEVLELLTYGKTNKDIADILELSVSTISGYLKAIFLKLDVSDRVSASMRAQSLPARF